MFSGHYDDWRISRMKGVKKYIPSEYFKDKTILELGCGYADIGNMFYQLGADVTSSDARREYLEIVRQKYPHIKRLRIDCDRLTNEDIHDNNLDNTLVDKNSKIVRIEKKYDIIVHWGVLYHLREIEKHLEEVSYKCDVLLLETEVSDSDNKELCISVNEGGYDQAFNNTGIRPSPAYIETILQKNGFSFKLIKDPILNSGCHCYDWDIQNSNTWWHGLRRFWICWKNISSPISIQI